MSALLKSINQAESDGHLLPESADNLAELLGSSTREVDRLSVRELIDAGRWDELNFRFFKKLSFGTSGLRGRTIGKVVTVAEQGTPTGLGRPEFPCVGTNAMNYYNLSRAAQGLVRYVVRFHRESGAPGKPAIVFAHDTRHFSREFAEFCAGIVTDHGCDAHLFDSHRPTPELSFAVRHLNAQAGVMHTASHNPPHDNGFKVYFDDGSSIIDPVAAGIITEVRSVESDAYDSVPEADRGKLTIIGPEMDAAYLERLQDVLLQPALLEKASGLKIVFTPIHGTGGVHVPAVLERLGFTFITVPEQDVPDGRFPTVKSPNPENADALAMAIDLAEKECADIVLATDPDCDRLGVAVRDRAGAMTLLTGNQIGSLMAWYRTKTLFDLGILNDSNKGNAVIIKTLVTTDLQAAIAERYGVPIVETLTGFKFIGAKLKKYEEMLPADVQSRYRSLTTSESRDAHLAGGRFFVFGGEESYGYLGSDFVRDKDGNAAVIMFAELAAYASSRSLTLVELMDEVYADYGYFLEQPQSLQFDGPEGAKTMDRLAASYSNDRPTEVDGSPVTEARDYGVDHYADSEGDPLPKEKMLIIKLEDGRSFAVRPSGTEPKMKFYLFGNRRPPTGQKFSPDELAAAKEAVAASLENLWKWVNTDMEARLA
ncbi:phosphoglucomutase [soil metagenome]